MRQFNFLVHAMTISATLLALPASAYARGGGGGGHFVGGGGGVTPGARGGAMASPGVRGYAGGYRGIGHAGPVGFRGYGWGYPGYFGWGFPNYGYGLGLGLGLGYGLGASYGYGYPSYGYYGNGSYYSTNSNTVPSSVLTASATTTTTVQDETKISRSHEFTDRGATAFKAADYQGAVYAWKHAVVDDPQNPVLTLQLAQALFAIGKFEESAGATQAAMHQLPKEQWGTVVSGYKEMYGDALDYTRQLRALEKAVKDKPNNPGLRFLEGYHYGYLGYLKQSIVQLDRVIEIESRDEMAKKLRDEMKSRLAKLESPLPPAPAPVPAISASWSSKK